MATPAQAPMMAAVDPQTGITSLKPPLDDLESSRDSASLEQGMAGSDDGLVLEKSRGVEQMDRLKGRMSLKYKLLLYGSFALLAYVMSLDQYINRSFLTAATSYSFAAHSTLTTISSIKSVFQAVSQTPVAKISDVVGRVEMYAFCVFLYTLGYIITASAQSIYAYAAGASINVLGITSLFLLQNIIIADISSLRNRLFWSIFPSLPGTINVWVSGNISQDLLGARNEHASKWRWGIGMFCILIPFLATPIMLTLGIGMRKSKKEGHDTRRTRGKTVWEKIQSIFWTIDLIGLVLLVAGFGMTLTIITIARQAGGSWSAPHSVGLLTAGGVGIVSFVLWEIFGAPHPIIPLSLLTNRTVIICFILVVLHPCAGGVIGSYFYTYLLVAGNESTLSATRITSIASFTSTWTALFMGVLVRKVRYLKPIILFGFVIEVLAFGLMIRYRNSGATQGDLAGVQFLRGVGSGSISFPVQAAIQSVVKHEHLAAITAGMLTVFYISQGVGSAIGGSIWSNYVPEKMNAYISNSTIAHQAYASPLGLISQYAPGTEIRDAMSRAQGETQRILSITGCCLAAAGLVVACFLEMVKLTDDVTLKEVEERDEKQGGQKA